MTLFSERPFLRLAVLGALIASLGLAACGRKGPLDLPPSASATGETQPVQNSPSLLNPVAVQPLGGGGNRGGSDAMETPKGEKKSILLDKLLN